jgi:hypothetical protein
LMKIDEWGEHWGCNLKKENSLMEIIHVLKKFSRD